MPTIGVTGASGFVGRNISRHFALNGWKVIAFGRDPRTVPIGCEFRHYDLDADLDASSLAGIDVMIHCAFIRASRNNKDAAGRNIRAVKALCESAVTAGARFIFLSTVLARPDANSEYGRHKYVSENMIAGHGAVIIQPGLVIGDGGLVRALYLALRRGPVPLIDRGKQNVSVVGVADLVRAIEIAIEYRLAGRLTVCSAQTVSIAEMARTMAARFGLTPRYLSIPWALAYAVARFAERIGIQLPISSDSLMGMRGGETAEPSAALAQHGFRARTWPELIPLLSFAPADGIPAQARE
jgi:nucleoside-diphosphate-sugar epimerase